MDDSARPAVSPDRVMATLTAYQRSAALTGALDLGLFSALGEVGPATADAIAARCAASSRGMRILCDYLTVDGFLAKEGDTYSLTPESAAFLDRRSPAYLGGAARFLSSPTLVEAFRDVAGTVRRGGTAMAAEGHGERRQLGLGGVRPRHDADAGARGRATGDAGAPT